MLTVKEHPELATNEPIGPPIVFDAPPKKASDDEKVVQTNSPPKVP